MFYDVSGTPFCKPAFSPLAQRKVDILKSKKRVPKVLRFTMFAELFSAKSSKKGDPNIMIYNVTGTPFRKVGILKFDFRLWNSVVQVSPERFYSNLYLGNCQHGIFDSASFRVR